MTPALTAIRRGDALVRKRTTKLTEKSIAKILREILLYNLLHEPSRGALIPVVPPMKPVLRNGWLLFLREPLKGGNDGEWRGEEVKPRAAVEWKDVFLGPIHVGFPMT